MNSTGFVKYSAAMLALAICSACTSPALAPSIAAPNAEYIGKTLSVNGRLVTAARANLSARPRFATLVPDQLAKPNTYEYIINDYGTYAGIFDYPTGDKQIGKISRVGGQGCTNVLYGNGKEAFWIVAGSDEITLYKVPKKPLKRLSISYGQPSSCAMDTSGDLAVGNLSDGDIVIFKDAGGSGTEMTTPLSSEYFDGYDNNGNLFFDGFNSSDSFELVELPKGSSTFQPITTSNTVKYPGSVQWDGTYLTVFDQRANAMYQYTVSGTKATLKGTVTLSGANDCAQTWIGTGVVFCADSGYGDGSVFEYPAGGEPIAVFTGNFDLPLGTVAADK